MSHADNADIKSTAAHIPPLLWCLMDGPECQATLESAPFIDAIFAAASLDINCASHFLRAASISQEARWRGWPAPR